MTRRPATGKPFEPGQSGNPGGRPKDIARVRELARAKTEAAFNILIGIAEDDEQPAAARVSAANSILDRGWGRPAQPLTGQDGEGGGVVAFHFSWMPEQT